MEKGFEIPLLITLWAFRDWIYLYKPVVESLRTSTESRVIFRGNNRRNTLWKGKEMDSSRQLLALTPKRNNLIIKQRENDEDRDLGLLLNSYYLFYYFNPHPYTNGIHNLR